MRAFWKNVIPAALGLAALAAFAILLLAGAGKDHASAQAEERRPGETRGEGAPQATRAPLRLVAEKRRSGRAALPPPEEKTVRIKAVTGLQYDKVRFTAQPGQRVRIALNNESGMMHNMVFTTPGDRVQVVKAALEMGADAPVEEYVPSSESVLAYTPVLKPGDFYELTFTAPDEEGAYPFVCTYPGHGYVMYGVMRVTREPGDLPPLAEDPLVPPDSLRGDVESMEAATLHPYSTKPPIVYRTFMPESGPASIAVGLAGGVSYNFDAGRSMLRYAWSGGFVDNSEIWRGHVQNQRAKLIGTVFFQQEGGFPLRFGPADGGEPAAPSFEGYRLVEGRPEFEYEVDGAAVRQFIRPAEGEAPGLVREFAIRDEEKRPVRFVASRSDSVAWRASAGTWRGDTLRLAPAEARSFTITMTRQAGAAGQASPDTSSRQAPRENNSSNASTKENP